MVVLSLGSLIISFVLSFSVFLLKYQNNISAAIPLLSTFLKRPFVNLLLLLAINIYRQLCNISTSIFWSFVFANSTIIIMFYFTRINFIVNPTYYSKIDYFIFFLLFLLATVFALIRLFFRIGHLLNPHFIENPNIFYIWEPISKGAVNMFTGIGKRVAGNMPPNTGTGMDRNFILGVGTFVATSVAAGGGIYLGYQGLLVAQRSADIAERALDIQERNAGNMLPEFYDAKWDKYGIRRK